MCSHQESLNNSFHTYPCGLLLPKKTALTYKIRSRACKAKW